jgi:hypothetical protein
VRVGGEAVVPARGEVVRHGLRHGGAVGALVAQAPAARLLLPHGREANVQPAERRHPPATPNQHPLGLKSASSGRPRLYRYKTLWYCGQHKRRVLMRSNGLFFAMQQAKECVSLELFDFDYMKLQCVATSRYKNKIKKRVYHCHLNSRRSIYTVQK